MIESTVNSNTAIAAKLSKSDRREILELTAAQIRREQMRTNPATPQWQLPL